MRRLLQILSWIALAATVLPPIGFFADTISKDTMKTAMLGATIAWFVVTPFWMGREKPGAATSEQS